ncbi:NEQ463 [Nanoarchaeum equitans Kin4-M]|uniref:NEQ463 n=1 Tax=Nanoarchaeum equitans (strain Kin4-M) TaxID=228908 RepID=Q74MY3_NANEQ|nr:NEQ463 [Nanoarchaeum equitans Kin4-M]
MVLVGIVGKPNVGKSTFFKALTLQPVEIDNRPFVTIEPNKGVAYVRVEDVGPEFGVISNPRHGFIKGKYRFVPIEVIDIAGLVPGAHEGKGLGNQFLDDIRKADGIIMVVDAVGATDEEGHFVGPGKYDPLKDIKWLEEELDYWFYNVLKRNIDKILRVAKIEKRPIDREIAKIMSGLNVNIDHVKKAFRDLNLDSEFYDFDDELLFKLAHLLRIYSKPFVIAANRIDIDPDLAEKNIERIKKEYPLTIPTSGYAEYILKELDKQGKISYIPGESDFEILKPLSEKEKKVLDFIKTNILERFGSTGVQNALDTLVFDVLKYIAVFPGGIDKLTDKEGNVLPDCFLLKEGSTVLDFARKIHEDLAKHFVKAIDVRTRKILGKDYKLKHRDVIHIVSSK